MIIDGDDNSVVRLNIKAEDFWAAKEIANDWLKEKDEKTSKERFFHLKISDTKSYECIDLN